MKISFFGAAETVTGSRSVVQHGDGKVLVDCGMFQGWKALRQRNWEPFAFDPASLDAVVLTHAHLDHSGMCPALVRDGFPGAIYATRATAALLEIMWRDSARILQEDTEYATRKGFSRHREPRPLYTLADAEAALKRLEPVDWGQEIALDCGMRFELAPAGHILGASSVLVRGGAESALFSGDVGRHDDILMPGPCEPAAANIVVMEGTYGDRLHAEKSVLDALGEVLLRTIERRGVALIPSFAVGRAQSLLRAIAMLKANGTLPKSLPIVVDSPMAVSATELYLRFSREHLLDDADRESLSRGVEFVRSRDASKALGRRGGPFVLISASGMLTGGRVLHHLAKLGPRPTTTLVFVGYQAPGTRGGRIVAGERVIRLHGMDVPMHCEVASIDGFSAHADQQELLRWLGSGSKRPERVVLNHGEPAALDALRQQVEAELHIPCSVARDGETIDVSDTAATAAPLPTHPPAARAQDADGHEAARQKRRITEHPNFRYVDEDAAFLQRPDMHGARLMLEHAKLESALRERGIADTLVVWGGSRLRETPWAPLYEVARELGRIAATTRLPDGRQLTVMTGGGPGAMEAANRGASEAGAATIGLRIDLPREQDANRWITHGLAFQLRDFAIRKLHFMARARALVAFPGGYGTLDELFEALCLVQTRRLPQIPIVLVGTAFWRRAVDLNWLHEQGMVDRDERQLYHHAETAEQAWQVIADFYNT